MIDVYLDDVRTPYSEDWVIVRSYEEFVDVIVEHGLDGIRNISLDHDLGDTAMQEYFNNVSPNYTLNYDNIKEKTGMDCAKFLVSYFYDTNLGRDLMDRSQKKTQPFVFPRIFVHSANPIGSANIIGYINNFFMNEGQSQDCVRIRIPHTVENGK